jgi:protein gp37
MGEKTGISWCDHTFNPWIGCTKVSEGCVHCYAERDNNLYKWVSGWGEKVKRHKTSVANWKKPRAWNKAARLVGERRKVFCASLADVFEDRLEVIPWRGELFDLIEATPDLDWLILTKRPENIIKWYGVHPDEIHDNVWLGVTVENQEMADLRIPLLLDIPARVRFLSVEPMLGPVDLEKACKFPGRDFSVKPFDWVICGGESGSNDRPMELDWARKLQHDCFMYHIPFFFKQHGGTKRIDGHWGGILLDGIRYHEFPEVTK